jgi:hypothetical protein
VLYIDGFVLSVATADYIGIRREELVPA